MRWRLTLADKLNKEVLKEVFLNEEYRNKKVDNRQQKHE